MALSWHPDIQKTPCLVVHHTGSPGDDWCGDILILDTPQIDCGGKKDTNLINRYWVTT